MSSPSFVPERNEIWYSDGLSGFYNVRLTNGAWPGGDDPAGAPAAPPQHGKKPKRKCTKAKGKKKQRKKRAAAARKCKRKRK
jgi:hypothetical protein